MNFPKKSPETEAVEYWNVVARGQFASWKATQAGSTSLVEDVFSAERDRGEDFRPALVEVRLHQHRCTLYMHMSLFQKARNVLILFSHCQPTCISGNMATDQ